MTLTVNGRELRFGNLDMTKLSAHNLQKNFYTFAEDKISGKELGILYDIIGDSSKLYQRVAIGEFDEYFKGVWTTKRYNLVDIAMKFSPETDLKEFKGQFKSFVVVLRDFHMDLYSALKPKLPNGQTAPFKQFLSEEVVRIQDPLHEFATGIYGSEYAAAMCFFMFGRREDFEEFRIYVKQYYGPTLYENNFEVFFDQLSKAKFRGE